MKTARIQALFHPPNSPLDPNYRFMMICGLDSSNQIVPGEWSGYFLNEGEFYPFVYRHNASFQWPHFDYGNHHDKERTNIGLKTIVDSEEFTVRSPDKCELIYQITQIETLCQPTN